MKPARPSTITYDPKMPANNSSVAESDSFVLKLAEMVERRVEGVKVMLPKQLKGNEPTQKMAVIFYATWAKLEGEESISAGGRLRALADNVNQSHALDVYLTRLNVLHALVELDTGVIS